MAKKKPKDPTIKSRFVDDEGYIHCYDADGRSVWSDAEPQRVVLIEDLRKYGDGLHRGQLGWTVPPSPDPYKWAVVRFDSGPQIDVLVYGIERVPPERADEMSAKIIAEHRGTRFDADPAAAALQYREWLKEEFSDFIDAGEVIEDGDGPDELYAFTFASLRKLAALEGRTTYPIKIGYTKCDDGGAYARVRTFAFEKAGFPERPLMLLVFRTPDGRGLETYVHAQLRAENRRIVTAPGNEWFEATVDEVIRLCRQAPPPLFGSAWVSLSPPE